MNIVPELTIGHVPWRYAAGQIATPGLRLVEGKPWQMRFGDERWPLWHVRPEEGPREPQAFAVYAKATAMKGSRPIVVGPYVRENVRRALEAAGVSYLDFHGNVHLVAPGLLVHVQLPAAQALSRGIGVAGVRAAQTILGRAEHAWGVTELAQQARVSAGLAQSVMKILETESLVYTEGRGPSRKRRITDRGRFLDWLSRQGPGRVPRSQLPCALYGRTPEDLWQTISARLDPTEHAITGAAAASILGVGPTALPRTIVRVASRKPLRSIAESLKAEPTERGTNLLLWTDTGELGITGSTRVGGLVTAPTARVYLDLDAEIRGADLASEFREQVLGY